MPSKGRRFFRSVFWINRCSVDTKSRIIVNNSPSDSTAFAKILSSPLAAVNSTSWLPVTYADYLQQIALPLHAFLVTDVSSYLHLLGADVAYWWVIISVSDIIVWSKPQQSFEYGAQFAFYYISPTSYEKLKRPYTWRNSRQKLIGRDSEKIKKLPRGHVIPVALRRRAYHQLPLSSNTKTLCWTPERRFELANLVIWDG